MKAVFVFLLIVPTFVFARAFETERPTKTRSAYTVQKKAAAIETDFINYREDEESDSFETNIGKSLIRFGLTPDTELQLELTPYLKVNDADGIGETRLGFKSNYLGNDDGDLVVSYGAYIELPTSGAELNSEETEAGFFIPLSYDLSEDVSTALTMEINNVARSADWQTNFSVAYSVAYQTFENSYLILEVFNEMGLNDEESNNTTLNAAFQYSISNELKVDVGFFKGISPGAKDEEIFTGVGYLF